MRVDIPVGLQLLFGTRLLCCVEEDGTSGLVIDFFDDLDKVGTDVELLHGCPQRGGEISLSERQNDFPLQILVLFELTAFKKTFRI